MFDFKIKRNLIWRSALLIFGLLSMSQLSFAIPTANEISFSQGSIATTVQGVLSPKQNDIHYDIEAERGQYTVINLTAIQGIQEFANVGVLILPSGEQSGTKGGIVYQDCLPETGTYQLRIARNLMATQGGSAGYQAEIIMLPVYASDNLCN